jgi:2-polyprenyl-3-methyl-5-hydroxy-6-metoxy-1,4-benzoquinol methylase
MTGMSEGKRAANEGARCWCGSDRLAAYSPDYLVCGVCGTLVLTDMPGREITRVQDEERDFYGRRYWFEYQEQQLGTPNITVRARSDLPRRCVHWLRTVLRYRLPPAATLDVGCGHGALVMLLRRAGYAAKGLELSPWVVDFARETFDVPVLLGPLEAQSLAPGSLDVITLLDVLEHLPDPLATLRTAVAALDDAGLLVIQTPSVPADLSWREMVAAEHPFLPLMQERGHLYLFTEASLRRLLVEHLGLRHVSVEPAYFSGYDMYVVAARHTLVPVDEAAASKALGASADGRLVQGLLDLDEVLGEVQARYAAAEDDRLARLGALHDQGAQLKAMEGERNVLRAELEAIKAHVVVVEAARDEHIRLLGERDTRLLAAEADRDARLTVIQEQAERLDASEADRAARLVVIHQQGDQLAQLAEQLAISDADRAARLAVIHQQAEEFTERLTVAEADRAARLEVIHEQAGRLAAAEGLRAQVQHLTERLAAAETDRDARLEVIHEQSGQIQTITAERDAVREELAALRARSLRMRMHAALNWCRARLSMIARFVRRDALPMPVTSAPPDVRPAAQPSTNVTVHENLDDYVRTIDVLVGTRPSLGLVRGYNHAMIDALAACVPLAGRRFLDIGASAHGFALESALAQGVAVYTGMGLGIWEPLEVRHQGAVGRLVTAYGEALPLEAESVDVAMTLSTFEHFTDGAAVLREIHRVLCPGGTLFVNFQPVWTSFRGHHLHHLPSVANLLPPWAHLLWTPATMRRTLASRWPADATMSLDEAIAWIYERSEINRVDAGTLRRMFETGPFTIEWMTPLRDDDAHRSRLADYLATVLPYSAEELLTLGFSILMRKA